MGEKKIAGVIRNAETAALTEKMEQYQREAIPSVDSMYVAADMRFYVHAKHPTIVGVEATIALSLADVIALVAPALHQVILPMTLAAQIQLQQQKAKATS
jgi:hypothetical protein